MVIFLAGLTSISEEVMEAARIDGAVGWQSLFYIVLPLMKPIFEFAFIMDTIGSFKLFTEPNVLMAGRPLNPDIAPVMNILVSNMNGGSFGMAAATGWMLFALIIIFVALQTFVFKRGNG
jgi:ABC-type sugar transport system permease subunit